MKKIFIAAAFLACAAAAQAADKDPVLMTIDGQDIRLSEFDYLYNKNNAQQAEPVTFDQYVGMFVDYKLKVADARAAGIDTTQAFMSEFNKFRNELALPYLRNQAAADRVARATYDRMGEEVLVSHIMLPIATPSGIDNKAMADSIRDAILSGEITFEDAAARYSVDKRSAQNGGHMGWVLGNSGLPWQFEEVAYATPINEVSEPVNSGFGYHLIRPEGRRPARGEVKASHILILTQDMDADQRAKALERIDSIYSVATPATFASLATRFSQDPGSARRGGDLGWFGTGKMVAEFDSAAFATPVGTISRPFATSYGYHIVMPVDRRGGAPLPPYEEMLPAIQEAINKDSRSRIPIEAFADSIAQATNSRLNPNIANQVNDFLTELGVAVTDPAALAKLAASPIVAYTIDGENTTLGQIMAKRPLRPGMTPFAAGSNTMQLAKGAFDAALLEIGRDQLLETNADYRNLVNEYRDGILLFEISNRNVWEKASKDKEGLEAYFQAHRDNYTWDAPRFKSYVIFANNDSVMQLAQAYVAGIDPASVSPEAFANDLKQRFGRDIKVERVIAAQGENPITDYLGFGAPKPEPQAGQRWAYYFPFAARLISAPEEAADVKSLAINDYQAALEAGWIADLHKRHKVKINDKVLRQARQAAQQ